MITWSSLSSVPMMLQKTTKKGLSGYKSNVLRHCQQDSKSRKGEQTMSKKMGMDRQIPTQRGVAAEIETLPGIFGRRLDILYVLVG